MRRHTYFTTPFRRTHLAVFLCLAIATADAAQLQATDGANNDHLGNSGSIGLVGAPEDDTLRGSAYAFRILDTATGTVTQSVKLTASDRGSFHNFAQ